MRLWYVSLILSQRTGQRRDATRPQEQPDSTDTKQVRLPYPLYSECKHSCVLFSVANPQIMWPRKLLYNLLASSGVMTLFLIFLSTMLKLTQEPCSMQMLPDASMII